MPTAFVQSQTIQLAEIKGHVTVIYDSHWWLACVKETLPASQEVTLSFLHPHTPSPSFKFPYHPYTLIIYCQGVLTVVEPVTETGRVYKMSVKEMKSATKN